MATDFLPDPQILNLEPIPVGESGGAAETVAALALERNGDWLGAASRHAPLETPWGLLIIERAYPALDELFELVNGVLDQLTEEIFGA